MWMKIDKDIVEIMFSAVKYMTRIAVKRLQLHLVC